MKKNLTLLFNLHSRSKCKVCAGKRFATFLCMLIFVAGFSFAQSAPSNKAFYLIGTMNGWSTLNEDEAANYEYKLTDDDGDEVYTGSFYIPEGELEFKVFSEPGGWNEAPYFGYIGEYGISVFNEDCPNSYIVLADGNSSYNLRIDNWKGGILTISMIWVQTLMGSYVPEICSIEGSGQPGVPEASDIYIIGNFNNWRLPDSTSENGAIKSTYRNPSYVEQFYTVVRDFQSGDISMAVCKYNENTKGYEYLKLDSDFDCPFTLYKLSDNDYKSMGVKGNWVQSSDPESLSINVKDWNGGNISMNIYDLYRGTTEIYFYNASDVVTEFPSEIYILLEYDGVKEIVSVNDIESYLFTSWAYCYGNEVSIIFTSENSLNPKSENCWGLEKPLAEYGLDRANRDARLFLVKGGYPFSYKFNGSGELTVVVDFSFSQANVNLAFYSDEPSAMYVVGEVENNGIANGWREPSESNADFYNQYFKLDETSTGVFEGTYYIPAKGNDLPNFRFYSALTGWDGGASVGSVWNDFNNIQVNLEAGEAVTTIVTGGKGNWSPVVGTNWVSNYVHMTVDTNNLTLTLEIVDENMGGSPEIESESDSSECWYNLQGMRVDRPQSGMYILVKDGKSSVRILK